MNPYPAECSVLVLNNCCIHHNDALVELINSASKHFHCIFYYLTKFLLSSISLPTHLTWIQLKSHLMQVSLLNVVCQTANTDQYLSKSLSPVTWTPSPSKSWCLKPVVVLEQICARDGSSMLVTLCDMNSIVKFYTMLVTLNTRLHWDYNKWSYLLQLQSTKKIMILQQSEVMIKMKVWW